jgi:hemoglobin-like flavoprotein
MDEAAQRVNASYGRCFLSPGFFEDFYQAFMGASPRIAEKFANTDMEAQRAALKDGIIYLIMYYRGSGSARRKIEQLGRTHSRKGRDIPPDLYEIWLRVLLETVDKHDGPLTPERRQDWETVLRKGIQVMKAQYDVEPSSG